MRLLKAQNTNQRSIIGKGVKYQIDEEIVFDSNNSILIPKGNTSERPAAAANGHVRYNTETNQLEAYADGIWKDLRFNEPNPIGITQQNLGNGDAVETSFGPLDSGDPNFPVPEEPQNVFVFVENVFQIAGTNYNLSQNPPGLVEGFYIEFTSPPDAGKPVTVLHNFDK